MNTPRISASSYSNTAPLVWSFLYGANHGKVEIILDNAPARSAELLAQNRVDAALVPVIASQLIDGVKLIHDVCVGARKRVRSVCLVTKGDDLENVHSVSLDVSSKTSVVLTKIIFREFLGFEPEWRDAKPDINAMLTESDAALLIGDPALAISSPPAGGGVAAASADGVVGGGLRIADLSEPGAIATGRDSGNDRYEHIRESAIRNPQSAIKVFDLAELWHTYTGLGFVFAMWMTRREGCPIDFAAARDEGLSHLDEIVANYTSEIGLGKYEMLEYLSKNISYAVDDSMRRGLDLFFRLAEKHGEISRMREPVFI